ncbi:hypothetical protein [Sphingomonas pruni]|uniref:hypothetical protein n=1 Tax=Sphingomonas pruni TaxID=40683 RepID=UPI00083564F2|nr:hypothetical protein [Sphingomonas pruni]
MTISAENGVEATLRLTPDEAIVLFDLLTRWSAETGAGDTPASSCFESTAEGAVLNGLLCDLEKQLVAPFTADYARIVEAARGRLASQWDYPTLRG